MAVSPHDATLTSANPATTSADATGITYPLPGGATWANTSTVSYGYDKADELSSITDFNGNKISPGYTVDGLPNSLVLGSSGDSVATTYDPTGSPSAIDLNNGSSTLLGFSYSDTPSGNISAETDTPTSSQSPVNYTYDVQSRVTSMTPGTGSTQNYGFDASGNLTTLPSGAAASYDHASELTSSALSGTTTTYNYDSNGQRLTAKQGSSTTASGTWNGAGELTAYSNPAANMTGATYDGNGLRASTTTTPPGGSASTQNFVWDTATSALLMDSINAYIYGLGPTPTEQVNLANGTVTYLVSDALGSVRGAVGAAGILTASTSYDAWGNPQTPGGLTSRTPFGYAGGYTDPTGLIYLINRYYDPATGQFLSVDPAVGQTGQPYAYTGGNPVNDTDPTGLRTGWWAPVACGQGACNFASEAEFQYLLFHYFFKPVAAVRGWHAKQQPYTRMKLYYNCSSCRYRVPDIYYYSHTCAHMGCAGKGKINELKIGHQYWRSDGGQANFDSSLLHKGGGWGANRWDKNRWLPIGVDVWWFAPDSSGYTTTNETLFVDLQTRGINIIWIESYPSVRGWPRSQTNREKEHELDEIESNDASSAHSGANSMFHSCPMVCRA